MCQVSGTVLCAALFYISVIEVWMKEEYDYVYEDESQNKNCSVSEVIRKGQVSYSLMGARGSVLTYHCASGHYPYPVHQRFCNEDGEWSIMRLANGKPVSLATCKEILCPAQLQLDRGDFWPMKQWFKPGDTQSFSCHSGFTLYGSAVRNCTLTGEWTGTIPICNDQVDDCSNPGTPPGALRAGDRFRIGEKIQYHCQMGMDLLGSAERVCLESKEWSGSESYCQAQYVFDSPSVVAQALAGSFSGIMDVFSPEFKRTETLARSFDVQEGRLNIYILMDTSGSILTSSHQFSQQHFEGARDATINLIKKLDSYEVKMRIQVISYASQAIEIVQITDDRSSIVDYVLEQLETFDYKSHGTKTGTNLHAALSKVYQGMAFLKAREQIHFNETQNVILIETDGHSNTGPSPMAVLAQIRSLLGYSTTAKDHTEEHLLDVYVFGVGDSVNKNKLNSLVSSKQGEKHIFILKNYKQMGEVFNNMISDAGVTMCGVAQEDVSQNQKESGDIKMAFTHPWHASIFITGDQKCLGSILSTNWILTAAHCFKKRESSAQVDHTAVKVKHGEGYSQALGVILHPNYNLKGLKMKNVDVFYDYDVALVKVQTIKLSSKARPICLPCTKSANRAMKMNPNSTCDEHKKALLHIEETMAHFFSNTKLKATHIQTRSRRPDCIAQAVLTLSANSTASLAEYVTDRFLCSGGSHSYQDAVSCKGDSGGALFLRKKLRYFQVGVVSWGTKNVCDLKIPGFSSDKPPPEARDFHISLFSTAPWLKGHLGQEIEFLPMGD